MGIKSFRNSLLLLFLLSLSACQKTPMTKFAPELQTGLVASATPGASPSKTNKPTMVKTLTATPTNTKTPTKTPTLTKTPTITPTPRGGGFGQIAHFCFFEDDLQCGIFLTSTDGSNRIKIGDGAWSLDWSADGEYLAYEDFDYKYYFICRLTIADRTELCIPNTYYNLRDIVLSPDGSKMVLSAEDKMVIWDLADNSLDQTAADKGFTSSWSPDGKSVVYTGKFIFLYNIETQEKTQLTSGSLSHSPLMSPDGEKIVYSYDSLSKSELYMMNADGSNKTRLTFNDKFDRFPAWSPDSRKIAYISFYKYSKSGIEGDLYIYDLATKQTLQITRQRGISSQPSWSPDGQWIAFTAEELNNLYVIKIDGSEEYLLVEQLRGPFAWRP